MRIIHIPYVQQKIILGLLQKWNIETLPLNDVCWRSGASDLIGAASKAGAKINSATTDINLNMHPFCILTLSVTLYNCRSKISGFCKQK